MSINAS